MRGRVMKTEGKRAVIIDDKGGFVMVRNRSYANGEEIKVAAPQVPAVAALALIFVLLFSGSALAYNLPYTTVTMDINPSIEITSNIFDRVIAVKADNEEAEQLIHGKNLKHKNLYDCENQLIDELILKGYLDKQNKGVLMLGVIANNPEKAQRLQQALSERAKEHLEKKQLKADVISGKVAPEQVKQARDMGISPGKYKLILRLKALDPTVIIEDYADVPVKDIMEKIKVLDPDGIGWGKDKGIDWNNKPTKAVVSPKPTKAQHSVKPTRTPKGPKHTPSITAEPVENPEVTATPIPTPTEGKKDENSDNGNHNGFAKWLRDLFKGKK